MGIPPVQLPPPGPAPVLPPATGEGRHFYQETGWRLGALGIWVALASALVGVLALVGWLTEPLAFRWRGLQALLSSMLPLALMMPAMVMILAAGGVDLSVGSVAALASVVAAVLMERTGMGFGPAVAVALLAGGGIGLLNGLLVGAVRIHSVLVTLGVMIAARHVGYLLTDGRSIYIGAGAAGALPGSTVVFWAPFVVVFAGAIALVQLTPLGRRPAPGPPARRESPVARAFYVGAPYVLSALMAALAGIVWLVRMRTGGPTMAMGYEAEVLLAVTIGGTALGGRFGTVLGGLVGVFFVGLLRHLLVLRGASGFLTGLVQGSALLVFAVTLKLYYWIVERVYQGSRARRAAA